MGDVLAHELVDVAVHRETTAHEGEGSADIAVGDAVLNNRASSETLRARSLSVLVARGAASPVVAFGRPQLF